LNISLHEAEMLSLEAIGRFVEASERLRFTSQGRQQVHDRVEHVPVQQEYARLAAISVAHLYNLLKNHT
jgi:hypothetical protein